MNLGNTFYKDFQARKYSLPEGLYETIVTAVENKTRAKITINYNERPTKLERLKELHKLNGIDIVRTKREMTRDNFVPFEYKVVIRPKAFLNNLAKFYDTSMEKISDDNVDKVLDKVEKIKKIKDKTPKDSKKNTEQESVAKQADGIPAGIDEENLTPLGKELVDIIRNITQEE